jgi:hypothetical protein
VTSFRARAPSRAQTNESTRVAKKKQPAPSSQKRPGPALPNLFRGRGLGFTINYPDGWEAERLDDKTVQIVGPAVEEAMQVHALVMAQGYASDGTTAESLMETLRAQIAAEHPKAEFQPVKNLGLAGGKLTGKQCVVVYYEGWDRIRQWQGILKKEDGSYIAALVRGPIEAMNANVQNINKMIDSLSPTR